MISVALCLPSVFTFGAAAELPDAYALSLTDLRAGADRVRLTPDIVVASREFRTIQEAIDDTIEKFKQMKEDVGDALDALLQIVEDVWSCADPGDSDRHQGHRVRLSERE